MNDPDKQTDNALAYAAVSLLGNATQGSKPEWHELSAWRAGTLSAERSAQVLSHVANDPDYFQQWLDMVEAEQWVEEESAALQLSEAASTQSTVDTDRTGAAQPTNGSESGFATVLSSAKGFLLSLFQQPLPVYGGAMAAIMLAVLIAPLMRQSNTLTLQQQLDRSLDSYVDTHASLPTAVPIARNTRALDGLFDELSNTEIERQYFQQGLRKSAVTLGANGNSEWQDWLTNLNADSVDCGNAIDSAHCENVADDIDTLGQWTLLGYAACQQGVQRSSDDFWSEQYALYERFSQQTTSAGSELFAPLLNPLDTQTPEALCANINQLLANNQ